VLENKKMAGGMMFDTMAKWTDEQLVGHN